MISAARVRYYLVDADGAPFDPGEGAEVDVHVDALTEEMYAERGGVRYALAPAGERARDELPAASSQKELQQILQALRRG